MEIEATSEPIVIKGLKGDQGVPGVNGVDGIDGKDGVNGINGKDADMARVAALEARVTALEARVAALEPVVVPPVVLKKFFPGVYVSPLTAGQQVEVLAKSNVTGVQKKLDWASLQSGPDQYTFQGVADLLKAADDVGKKVWLRIENFQGGTHPASYPQYIQDMGGVVIDTKNSGLANTRPRLDLPRVNDEHIKLYRALLKSFDGHPALMAISQLDSIVCGANAPADWLGQEAWRDQYMRFITETAPDFKSAVYMMALDYGMSPELMPDLVDHAFKNKCGITGPDAVTDNQLTSNTKLSTNGLRVYAGWRADSKGVWTRPADAVDYRGKMLCGYLLSAYGLGGLPGIGSYGMYETFRHCTQDCGAQMFPVIMKTWQTGKKPDGTFAPNIYWKTGPSPLMVPSTSAWIDEGSFSFNQTRPENLR